MFVCKIPIYKELRPVCGLCSFLFFKKIVNDRCSFSERNVIFGRIFEINTDTRIEQVEAGFAGTLVADIEMNDETDEF